MNDDVTRFEDVPGGMPRLKHGVDFGAGAMPCVISKARMQPKLLAYLVSDPMLMGPEAELEERGFDRCVDHPNHRGHVYYEGYFHAVWGDRASIRSMNPRNGIDFDKPAAPARLTAFIEGVRRRNSALLADSVAGSRWLEAAHTSGDLFSDLAVQVHYGDPIGEDVLARGGGWHVDGPNSTLHMGISLHGERKLHVELTEPGESPCEIRERGCDGKWPDGYDVHPNSAGDIYVSNPTGFRHAVEYPACGWDDRVIALQARVLIRDSSENGWERRDTETRLEHAKGVTGALLSVPFALPDLDEVLQIEKELQKPGGM